MAEKNPGASVAIEAAATRINFIGHRLRAAEMEVSMLRDRMNSLPGVFAEAYPATSMLDAWDAFGVHQAAARELMAAPADVAPLMHYQTIVQAPDRLADLAGLVQRVAGDMLKMSLALAPIESRAIELQRESRIPVAQRKSALAADPRLSRAYASLLMDARWLEGRAARLRVTFDAKPASSAERVRRLRARQREGLVPAQVHYRDNDLAVLHQLGFLPAAPPYSAADVAIALDSFLQMALALVQQTEDPSAASPIIGSALMSDWAERLRAITRAEDAGEKMSPLPTLTRD